MDGRTYDFSMPGGGFVSFTDLVEVLGLAGDAAGSFVADVESVEFSSPELVWVGKVENDSTVSGLREEYGLVSFISGEPTEEQIAERSPDRYDERRREILDQRN